MNLRPAIDQDYGLILSSFISTFRSESTHAEDLKGRQITSLLTNLIANGWSCTVAYMEGVLVGWIVHAPKQRLAWVWVRSMVRAQGLAKLMIERAGIDINRPVVGPFLPNRNRERCRLRLKINHRPFLVIPSHEAIQ